MSSIFPRVVDIVLIVSGAFTPIVAGVGRGYARVVDEVLVEMLAVWAAAFALSVFPACGIYARRRVRSPARLIARTMLAWCMVQGCCIVLLVALQRAHLLSTEWFAYWTLTTGIGLVIFRATALAMVSAIGHAGRRVHAAAVDRVAARADASFRMRVQIKRAVDVTLAVTLIMLLSPLLVAIALVVKCDGGPSLYAHRRVGRSGRPFMCLKFRTMAPNADVLLKTLLDRNSAIRDEWERGGKLRNDARITPIGRFLRRTSLDELPQLFNVVRGDMSLVGPRPIVEAERSRYGDAIVYYLAMRPGMTGLWQVSGRNDTTYATRVSLDVSYVRTWTLNCDLRILLKTVGVVVRGAGAY